MANMTENIPAKVRLANMKDDLILTAEYLFYRRNEKSEAYIDFKKDMIGLQEKALSGMQPQITELALDLQKWKREQQELENKLAELETLSPGNHDDIERLRESAEYAKAEVANVTRDIINKEKERESIKKSIADMKKDISATRLDIMKTNIATVKDIGVYSVNSLQDTFDAIIKDTNQKADSVITAGRDKVTAITASVKSTANDIRDVVQQTPDVTREKANSVVKAIGKKLNQIRDTLMNSVDIAVIKHAEKRREIESRHLEKLEKHKKTLAGLQERIIYAKVKGHEFVNALKGLTGRTPDTQEKLVEGNGIIDKMLSFVEKGIDKSEKEIKTYDGIIENAVAGMQERTDALSVEDSRRMLYDKACELMHEGRDPVTDPTIAALNEARKLDAKTPEELSAHLNKCIAERPGAEISVLNDAISNIENIVNENNYDMQDMLKGEKDDIGFEEIDIDSFGPPIDSTLYGYAMEGQEMTAEEKNMEEPVRIADDFER